MRKSILITCLLLASVTVSAQTKVASGKAAAPAASGACFVSAGPTGVVLPPIGCGYITPAQVHVLLNDPSTPASVIMQLWIDHANFLCLSTGTPGPCQVHPGGPLGGEVEVSDTTLTLEIFGTGELEGYRRSVVLKADTITATGPRDAKAPYQDFANEMMHLDAVLEGDEDFKLLRITAGTENGFDSSGRTTIKLRRNNLYEVTSFFDINYEIEFVGDGKLEGLSAISQGKVTMEAQAGEN